MADLNNAVFEALRPIKPFLELVLPNLYQSLPQLVVLTFAIVLYGVIIYKFYHFLAKRDVFALNIQKYYEGHKGLVRTIYSTVLGIIKYGFFFPIVVFIWFACFTLLLSFLAKNISIHQLLLICITFVTAIRITSYYAEDLARDLAKLIPFALLAVALVEPDFFSLTLVQERISTLNLLTSDILAYFVFIILVEWFLRIILFFKHALVGTSKLQEPRS